MLSLQNTFLRKCEGISSTSTIWGKEFELKGSVGNGSPLFFDSRVSGVSLRQNYTVNCGPEGWDQLSMTFFSSFNVGFSPKKPGIFFFLKKNSKLFFGVVFPDTGFQAPPFPPQMSRFFFWMKNSMVKFCHEIEGLNPYSAQLLLGADRSGRAWGAFF